MEPFYETARLLYEGPWVAERYLVIRNLLASSPDAIHPVTREITAAGARLTAAETFSALYRLQGLRKIAERTFANFDAIVLPTAPTVYSTKQVLANPVELNSRLGTYTNFVNLLDLCGLALPAAMRADDIPFGITLLAPAGRDALLASIGRVFHADTRLKIGARGLAQPPLAPLPASSGDDLAIAVVGAHLSGMALNGELRTLGGRLLETAITAPDYKLYALATTPPKPGMLRVDPGKGTAIELEIWSMSAAAFGQFVAAVPPPLSIGTIRLSDGRSVKGFIVEAAGVEGARDISSFGGWRAYMAEKAADVNHRRHSGAVRLHRTRNLEILRCAIAHHSSRFARPGMTMLREWCLNYTDTAYISYSSRTSSMWSRIAVSAPVLSPRMIATTTRSCSACDLARRPRLRNWARRNGCTRTRVAKVISAI